VFYVFIDARDTISTLLLLIERKVLEIYRTNIVVKKVQDEFGIDLPPSYSIGSMLANNATVTVDHALCAPLPQKVLTGNWMRNQLLQSSSGQLLALTLLPIDSTAFLLQAHSRQQKLSTTTVFSPLLQAPSNTTATTIRTLPQLLPLISYSACNRQQRYELGLIPPY